jgi:hypothetical protein
MTFCFVLNFVNVAAVPTSKFVWRCWFVVVELGTAAINVVAVLLLLLVVQQQQQQHR